MRSVRDYMDSMPPTRGVSSCRAAAEICGTTPKTVKRSVEAARATEAGPVPCEVRRNYDEAIDVVTEMVARTRAGSLAKRQWPVAVAAGYKGSARNFRRLVAEAKSNWR